MNESFKTGSTGISIYFRTRVSQNISISPEGGLCFGIKRYRPFPLDTSSIFPQPIRLPGVDDIQAKCRRHSTAQEHLRGAFYPLHHQQVAKPHL